MKCRTSILLLHLPRAFRVAAVLAFSFLLCVQTVAQTAENDDSQAESQTGTVRGTVINSVTRAPIPRALVNSADNRYAALTDGDGHFEFTVPKQVSDVGTSFGYVGRGSRPRLFRQNHLNLFLLARKPGFLEPPMVAPETASENDIIIPLLPEGIIKGRVTATGDQPAAGVMVQILSRQVVDGLPRWVSGQTAQANSAGEFRFAELLPGAYKILTREWMDNDPAASVPDAPVYGFPPVYYPGVSDASVGSSIEVAAGQMVQADLQIVGQRYYQVKIPVANGDASNDLGISVEGQQGSRFDLGFNHSEQRIEGMLPSGNYVVQATTYGPNSVSGSVALRVADGPAEGPTLALTPNSSIPLNVKEEFSDSSWKGSMTWSDGRRSYALRGPRVYLQVRAESADGSERMGASLRPPTPADDRTLALESLAPGRYWLRISTARGYVASATMGSTDLLHQPFTVVAGSSAPIEITMRDDTAELDGTISSLSGQNTPPEGTSALVYCVPLPESNGQFQSLPVSEEGKFSAQTMAPGDYRILAFSEPQPNLPYRDAEAMKAYETKGQVVHLSPGQKTTVQLQSLVSPE